MEYFFPVAPSSRSKQSNKQSNSKQRFSKPSMNKSEDGAAKKSSPRIGFSKVDPRSRGGFKKRPISRQEKGEEFWPEGEEESWSEIEVKGKSRSSSRERNSDGPRVHRHLVNEIVFGLRTIFEEGGRADKVIERTLRAHSKWGSKDRKFFAETMYEMTRWWRKLTYEVGVNYRGPFKEMDFLVVWGRYWQSQGHELPDWFDAFVPSSKPRLDSRAVRESIPDWLDQLGDKELGKKWPAILTAMNQKATVFLRTNTLKIERSKLIPLLLAEGIQCEAVRENPWGIELLERKNVFVTDCFKKGYFEMQDLSSQEIATFAEVEPGMRVVDACAGAGGKSLHMAALMKNKGKILALDIHEWKLKELKVRASRDGVDIVETRLIDSQKVIKRLAETADRVLLDVPCSGLGVLKRNPDTKWQLNQEEMDRLYQIQKDILKSYSVMVKPGGKMVYATCSILPSENEEQVAGFLKNNPGWKLEEQLRIEPDKVISDGFYAARLTRVKTNP